MPDLSVIIPCFNNADTLPDQLDALTRQTEAGLDWDVLVADNGSSDLSRAVIAGYAQRLPQLRVIDADGRPGVSHARNTGAAATGAPWLAFTDADDIVADDWVAAMASALNGHAFVAGRFDDYQLNSARARASRPIPQRAGLQTSVQGLNHAGGSNLGIHHAVFDGVDGFDEEIRCLEDTDFCWRVQLAGTPLTFAPSPLVNVRLRPSLKGMWTQGANYGRAFARLNHAHPPKQTIGDRRGPTRRNFLKQSPEAILWHLAWHHGHRTERKTLPCSDPTR